MNISTGQQPDIGPTGPAVPHSVTADVTEGTEPPPERRGKIVRFMAEKGYGFIARFGEPELFFHVANLLDPNIPVRIGQDVCFRVEPSARRPGFMVAVDVRRIGAVKPGKGATWQ